MKAKGPEFIRFFKPILRILKESGGSGTTSEVIDRAIELLKIPESEQEVALKNGQSRIRNQVQWGPLSRPSRVFRFIAPRHLESHGKRRSSRFDDVRSLRLLPSGSKRAASREKEEGVAG